MMDYVNLLITTVCQVVILIMSYIFVNLLSACSAFCFELELVVFFHGIFLYLSSKWMNWCRESFCGVQKWSNDVECVNCAVVFLVAALLLVRAFYFMCIKISQIEGPA